MARTLAPIGDEFLTTASLILSAHLDLPHTPEQVWEALGSDGMGSWMAILDRVTWHSPRPFAVGARRSARLARLITLHEQYYRWDAPRRASFRVTAINFPLVRGWAEDFLVEPHAGGGTRLTWTMAIDNRFLRLVRIPRRLRPAVESACRTMMAGIITILPPPQTASAPTNAK
ncbi:SRPBCC family protein [Nocardia salmonicida]|uniref:SRPBCC family protein n=1 Tax=Nocardia salmonicida TaxID=53431 RepID=UPI003660BE9D